jgi:hypothetical protein
MHILRMHVLRESISCKSHVTGEEMEGLCLRVQYAHLASGTLVPLRRAAGRLAFIRPPPRSQVVPQLPRTPRR